METNNAKCSPPAPVIESDAESVAEAVIPKATNPSEQVKEELADATQENVKDDIEDEDMEGEEEE